METLHYTQQEIQQRRRRIKELFALMYEGRRVEEMDAGDVEALFWLYDHLFLESTLKRRFDEDETIDIEFVFGRFGYPGQLLDIGPNGETIDTTGITGHCQMITDGWSTLYRILLSRSIFSTLTFEKERSTNGLRCIDRLTCLMITLEHEIAHLIVYLYCPEEEDHGEVFLSMVKRLFGHSRTRHDLDL